MVITDGDVERIRSAAREIERATIRRDKLVRSARNRGATWTEVGYALGITAQGAQKRYGSGDERSQAHAEIAARRAIKRARKAARGVSG